MRRVPPLNEVYDMTAEPTPAWRMRALSLALLGAFVAIGVQLTSLGREVAVASRMMSAEQQVRHALSRPDIVDRHGRMLASDIRVYWLFADPTQILDADDTVEKLSRVLSAEDVVGLRTKLRGPGRFEWVKRGLTPKQAADVHDLGLPGLQLIEEPQRVYPGGATAVHILGHTNVDNQGLAGIEKYIDANPSLPEPVDGVAERSRVRLSLDLRIQYALHEEVMFAQQRYQAKAAGGIVLDVKTGEVIAMAGLPDYDPNRREESLTEGRHNRFYYDAYEMGSVFKTFAVANALDSGAARMDDKIDVLTPLRMGRFTLYDRHAKKRYFTVEEIFTHSSNTGAARLALATGTERQKSFFAKLGLMQPMSTELGPTARPLFPERWREVNTMTAAYGHGISVPPFAFAVANAALINGGTRVEPTFLPRSGERAPGERVVSPETSAAMRQMFLANVEHGTGEQAKVPGYRVGGKTGTAWKPAKGGYSDEVITSFVAAFPMDDPQYLVLIVIDEPKPEAAGKRNEAGHNAAPTAGAVIKRIAPMLGIAPARTFDESPQASY
ncbi:MULTISPECIES: penicillin-binding protein 2 [Rhodomicrobium]|uniref:peptidoglycan D,D-transpeptidase FtsI family protein n=1 Tax=Rhodomicrobium TaxID=1068 RepID=UPI000B4BE6DE|nr:MULTISPECIES: penicillin-binding protein 2 [Rhodomicrobium]